MNTKLLWRGMLGLRALTVTLMLAGFLAAGVRTTSAQDDESGLDDNTFTGPNFGWSVEWDEDVWEFDTEDNTGGSDFMRLQTIDEDLFALVAFQGIEFDGADTEECALSWEGILADGDANSDVELSEDLPLPDAPRDADGAAFTYVLELDGGDTIDLVDYNECRVLEEDTAVLQILLTVPANIYEDVIPLLEDLTAEIVLPDDSGGTGDDEDVTPEADDDETPEADDEETPEADEEETPEDEDEDVTPETNEDEDEDADAEPTRDVLLGDEDEEDVKEEDEDADTTGDTDESGVDGNEFVGPNFGWGLTWDEDVWTVDTEDNSGGSDFITFVSEDPFSIALFQGIEEFDGDPDDCADGWADTIEARGDVTDVEESTDLDTPREARGAAGAVFTYTLELDGGDTVDVVEYVQCQELVEGEAVLEIVLQATADDYEDAIPAFEDLIAEIEIAS